jgi:hypothetical protein
MSCTGFPLFWQMGQILAERLAAGEAVEQQSDISSPLYKTTAS